MSVPCLCAYCQRTRTIAERIDAAKQWLGPRYLLARPINRKH